ncbi:tRNA lysidine(34) synthetase TilS [Phaeobacter gallaeciensis]|uniref:tRNA(Ile)-lysidine synthase n=1 Tax=Phaeobacter gallaeciensis TaxID=60890 RepID=A0A366XDE7_9RHOB|nr:tRNA lysidine(34) synthetase TilS [Phaeobacter gallaeciensis]RBW61559.1 tRNA lysidine(34) synthetase TilS [Phaeobacter gallaeciensis]
MTNHLVSHVRSQFEPDPPTRIGVAVSGGGDSVALLHLLCHAFERDEVSIHAVTVDHGLRPEAVQEAQEVAGLAARLGVSHDILRWERWDGQGNLQDQARRARYDLMQQWAMDKGLKTIALGHTADDQAETVLMRLARGAGVSGLSAMSTTRSLGDVVLVRPILAISRADLRHYLETLKESWTEDPSNQDLRFDRIKVRQALEVLEPLGVTQASLSMVARNMEQAREALNWHVHDIAKRVVQFDGGDIVIPRADFLVLPYETRRRLLVGAVNWITASEYGPRRAAVEHVLTALDQGSTGSLGGCHVLKQGDNLRICREYNAVRDLKTKLPEIWDHRWQIIGPTRVEGEVRALGEAGLQECDDWRATGRPRAALLATPAVWAGARLIAAPLAREEGKWQAKLEIGQEGFLGSLLSH